MAEKAKRIEDIIGELASKRTNIAGLEDRTKKVIDEIETKLLTYLRNSKSLPSVATIIPIAESLASLYNINLNANSQLIRSLEKEVELVAKHAADDDGNLPGVGLTLDTLSSLMSNALQRTVIPDEEHTED